MPAHLRSRPRFLTEQASSASSDDTTYCTVEINYEDLPYYPPDCGIASAEPGRRAYLNLPDCYYSAPTATRSANRNANSRTRASNRNINQGNRPPPFVPVVLFPIDYKFPPLGFPGVWTGPVDSFPYYCSAFRRLTNHWTRDNLQRAFRDNSDGSITVIGRCDTSIVVEQVCDEPGTPGSGVSSEAEEMTEAEIAAALAKAAPARVTRRTAATGASIAGPSRPAKRRAHPTRGHIHPKRAQHTHLGKQEEVEEVDEKPTHNAHNTEDTAAPVDTTVETAKGISDTGGATDVNTTNTCEETSTAHVVHNAQAASAAVAAGEASSS